MIKLFHSGRIYFYILFGLLLLWIILFEFILYPNQILPEPSIAIISVTALFRDYNFLNNMISSVSALYFSLLAATILLWIIKRFLINNKKLFNFLALSLKWVSGIIPAILIGLFLIYWFPQSEVIKYFFIFFYSFTYLFIQLECEVKKVKNEFIDAAVSLGAGNDFVSDKVIWKCVVPALAHSLLDYHLNLWMILIIFEVINGGFGLGNILRLALQYKDLSALFSSIIFICFIIFIGKSIIKYFQNKYYSWSIN
jgi:NitT/TauT family transport system permease protein